MVRLVILLAKELQQEEEIFLSHQLQCQLCEWCGINPLFSCSIVSV